MKKMITTLALALLIISPLFSAIAEDSSSRNEQLEQREEDTKAVVNNFGKGVADTATFWADIPQQMIDTSKREGPLVGMTKGFVDGLMTSAASGLNGLYELLTFFIPKN